MTIMGAIPLKDPVATLTDGWLYDPGFGVARAARIEGGVLTEARVEITGRPTIGTVRHGRLGAKGGVGARIRFDTDGHTGQADEWWIDAWPTGLTEGARVAARLTREGLADAGRRKRPRARLVSSATPGCDGPTLLERISADGLTVVKQADFGRDLFTDCGWDEAFDTARSGCWSFDGGALQIAITPAMTVIDVDGWIAADPLALNGAAAAGRAIRLFDLAGSIAIDLPGVTNKEARIACAAAFDAALPQPFERTAVNGFGLLHMIRPRHRASLPEIIASDPAILAGAMLLNRAVRSARPGGCRLIAAPAVVDWIMAHPQYLDAVARRIGGEVALQADPQTPIWGGDVAPA